MNALDELLKKFTVLDSLDLTPIPVNLWNGQILEPPNEPEQRVDKPLQLRIVQDPCSLSGPMPQSFDDFLQDKAPYGAWILGWYRNKCEMLIHEFPSQASEQVGLAGSSGPNNKSQPRLWDMAQLFKITSKLIECTLID